MIVSVCEIFLNSLGWIQIYTSAELSENVGLTDYNAYLFSCSNDIYLSKFYNNLWSL